MDALFYPAQRAFGDESDRAGPPFAVLGSGSLAWNTADDWRCRPFDARAWFERLHSVTRTDDLPGGASERSRSAIEAIPFCMVKRRRDATQRVADACEPHCLPGILE